MIEAFRLKCNLYLKSGSCQQSEYLGEFQVKGGQGRSLGFMMSLRIVEKGVLAPN
jgi:hypothetical protein